MNGRISTPRQAPVIRPGGGPVQTRAQWPLASYLKLGALPTAVGCGRDHVRHVLTEWGLAALVDDAVLVTSELLTNALKASQALPAPAPPPIALRLLANDRQLIIEAWDQQTEGYKLQPPPGDEHGRGLAVVSALSRRWGTDRVSQDYKAIWCELLIPRQQAASEKEHPWTSQRAPSPSPPAEEHGSPGSPSPTRPTTARPQPTHRTTTPTAPASS